MTTASMSAGPPRAIPDYLARLVAAPILLPSPSIPVSASEARSAGHHRHQEMAQDTSAEVPDLHRHHPTVIDRINTEQVPFRRTVDEQERLARVRRSPAASPPSAALARSLDATVAAMSPAGRLLASAGPDGERGGGLGRAHRRQSGRGNQVASGRRRRRALHHPGAAGRFGIRGYLIVRADRPLSAAERLLIAHSVSLISIELEKPLGLLDAEQRLRIAVTRDLIAEQRIRESSLLVLRI